METDIVFERRFKMKEVMADSIMTSREGLPVCVELEWDDDFYYAEMRPCYDEEDLMDNFDDKELAKEVYEAILDDCRLFGRYMAYDLDEINEHCKRYCGDDLPAYFYYDDLWDTVVGGC